MADHGRKTRCGNAPSKWVEFARAEVAKTNFDQKMMLQAAVKDVAAR